MGAMNWRTKLTKAARIIEADVAAVLSRCCPVRQSIAKACDACGTRAGTACLDDYAINAQTESEVPPHMVASLMAESKAAEFANVLRLEEIEYCARIISGEIAAHGRVSAEAGSALAKALTMTAREAVVAYNDRRVDEGLSPTKVPT
jgi:hypothetical protein